MRHARYVVGMRLLIAFCVLTAGVLVAPPIARGQSPVCPVRVARSETLRLAGRQDVYIEPEALVRAGNDVLLIGTPAYVLRRGQGGTSVRLARDSVVGVVLKFGRVVHEIPRPPLGGSLVEWRAARLGERKWAVTFSQVSADSTPSPGIPVDGRLWAGVYEAGRWSSLSPIPIPDGWKLLPPSTSTLAGRSDTLALAMTMDSASRTRRLVLFERRGNHWSHRVLPLRAEYVELTFSESVGLAGVAASADSSVLLHSLGSPSGIRRRIDMRGSEALHEPSLAHGRNTLVLSWLTLVRGPLGVRVQANAMILPVVGKRRSMLVIDPDVNSLVHVPMPSGASLWLTDHVRDDGKRELRLLEASADTARVLWRLPNPFDGRFRAVALTNRRLLLVGPTFDRSRRVLASLAVQLDLGCDPSPSGRRSRPKLPPSP